MSMIEGEIVKADDALNLPANASPVDAMIMRAIESDMAPEALEKLMALRNTEQDRIAQREFVKAVAGFQGQCPEVVKEKKGSKGEYSPLEDIVRQVSPFLKKFGLSYRFDTTEQGDSLIVRCIVSHVGGHSESSEVVVPLYQGQGGANAAQVRGGQNTYGRRLAFTNALGIVSVDKDIDARLPYATAPIVGAKEADALRARFRAAGGTNEQGFLTRMFNVEAFEDLTKEQAKKAFMRIAEKERAR